MSKHSYIIAAKRSPVAPRDGALSNLELHQLCTPVVEKLIETSRIDKAQVDEFILGR